MVRGQFRVGSAWSAATQMVEGAGVGGSQQQKVRERRKNRDEGVAATGVYLYHIRLCVFMYYGRHGTGLPCDWVYYCTIAFMYVGVPALLFAMFYVVSRTERSENEIL